MSAITLYGIKNCDTVKKARRWLDDNGIPYHFHDVRTDGLDAARVDAWLQELGLDLINRRSTSWKALDEQTRDALNVDNARDVILAQPTLIKRPLLDAGGVRHVGFKPAEYQALLKA
ncbi:ArsC family reductase [Marinimicrobium agarilyticum]|uniref:ArsC family reductase n=1 Tax=Marinimicrobium agarilyticum TaxID=306546 RepID=UPI000426BCC7|nr:ArsC family reductase [Marinimicrobium agarilyticum]